MWPWFHSGWIIIVPIVMMVLCILLCVFMRGHVFGGCASCCGARHAESDAKDERSPKGDSRNSKG